MQCHEEAEDFCLLEAELGNVAMNSTGQKASDFEPSFEEIDCNNVGPETVKLRKPVMQSEASTYSTLLISRITRRVDEWKTDVSGGNFNKPIEEMSPFAKQTRVSSQLFTWPERSVRLSTQFTPTLSINRDDFSSFHQRSLPKLKNHDFDGNPLEWLKWSGMFLSVIDSSPLMNDQKMGHLKGLVSGKAKTAISDFGSSGAIYQQSASLEHSAEEIWTTKFDCFKSISENSNLHCYQASGFNRFY